MPHSPYPNENYASSFSLLFFSQVVTQKLLCLWTYPQLITTRMKLSHLWREHINLTLHWQLESATFLKYLSFVLPSIHLRCIWARCYFILLVFLGDKVNFLLLALLNDMSLTTLVTWFFPFPSLFTGMPLALNLLQTMLRKTPTTKRSTDWRG